METKYIKQYIEDMEGDKRADNLTEFGECLLKELKQLLSVCEQKQTEQKSNCNLPHVSVAKHPLPRPLEAWKQAREMELSDYIEWHLEQERRGNAR